jgi:hypothetical protein
MVLASRVSKNCAEGNSIGTWLCSSRVRKASCCSGGSSPKGLPASSLAIAASAVR